MPSAVCRLLALDHSHSQGAGDAVGAVPALSKLLFSSAAVPSILLGDNPDAMQDSSMEAACAGKGLPACAKELPRLQLPSLADLANGPGRTTLYYQLLMTPSGESVQLCRDAKMWHSCQCFAQINRGLQHSANVTSEDFILRLTKQSQVPTDAPQCQKKVRIAIQLRNLGKEGLPVVSRKLWAAALWLWHPASSWRALLLHSKVIQRLCKKVTLLECSD